MSKRPNRRLNIPSNNHNVKKQSWPCERITFAELGNRLEDFSTVRSSLLRPPFVRQPLLSMAKPVWDQVFFSIKCKKVVFLS
jgi:hypothetical protein